MTRLRSLIKEVLSQPKKKDCNCGCNDCGGKAPILTEGKVKHLISEGLQYHIDKKIQLHESVYRIGSEKHFELIREARALWVRGIIDVSEDDQAILETNLGHFGMYEGEEVPLDMPMVNESTFQGNEIAIYDGEDGETYIEKRGTGYYGYNNSFDFTAKDKAELEQKLNMWGYYPIAGSINEEEQLDENRNTKYTKVLTKIFRKEYEVFPFDYYQDGAKIVITPEGYNPDGTLFDMKDDWREDIIRVVRKYKPKWHIGPNMGGGLTIHFDASIDPIDNELLDEAKKKKKKKKKKKDPPLNKPKRGGSKAYYVYVRDPKTKKIVKVSFGSGGLRAKIKDKEKRNAFAARHNCKNKKDRTSPGYWSCNLPRYAEQLGLGSNMNTFW